MSNDTFVKLFEEVRDMPYRIPLAIGEEDVCCSGKARKLKNILENKGLQVRYRVCEFKWSDMEVLPSHVRDVSHDDRSTHVYLEVFVEGKWIKIDPTWDQGLSSIFPVAHWDGIHDTQVAVKEIVVYDPEKSRQIMDNESDEVAKKDLETNGKFYGAFNEWLEDIRIRKN